MSTNGTHHNAPGWWQLIAAGEPYRILFPVGTLLGVVGTGLWPVHVWTSAISYPGIIHARIMICGFLTAFVIGFLGTALPRLLDVPRFNGRNAATFSILTCATVVAYLCQRVLLGDCLFLFTLLLLIGTLLSRARHRKDTPPPGFVLVGFGLLSATAGIALFIANDLSDGGIHPDLYVAARLLLYQGYLLFPIMGIGAFLLPRFFGMPSRHSFPESLTPPPGWWPKAAFAATCGGAILLSFTLEIYGFFRLAFALRAAVVATYILREVPIHKADVSGGSLALSLRVSLVALPLGYVSMAFAPQWMMTLNHIIFITGFSLITFVVASRVILGHSGQSHRFRSPGKAIPILLGLMILALATRLSADWLPNVRLNHYGYAAATWITASIIWAASMLPAVRFHDHE